MSNHQSNELAILFRLCGLCPSMNADTSLMYAIKAKNLSEKMKDNEKALLAEFYIAECYNMKGMADTALAISTKALMSIPDIQKLFAVYRCLMWTKITSLTKLKKIKESINECFELLGNAERKNDVAGQVIASNCLGANYHILESRTEAISWVKKASSLFESDSNASITFPEYNYTGGLVYTNLAAMYFYLKKNDSGLFFLQKAYLLAKKDGNLKIESNYYNLKGQVFLETNQTDSAGYYLKKSLDIEKRIGSVQNILIGLDAMESFYGAQKKYNEAINYIREEQWYANKFDAPLVLQAYRDLATYYKELNNYTAFGETMDTLMMLKDSMYQKNKASDLAKLEAQYEISNKEAFIAKQKLELLHKNIWIAGSTLALLLLLSGIFITYRYLRRNQRVELESAEEKERRRIAADLHDNIGAYASAISDNIDEIESRKLIADSSSLQNLKNNATEIISSLRDTIWAFNKNAITLTGISDRLKIYIQKIQQSFHAIQINFEEDLTGEKKLSPVQALHTFRIVQEALHNALRHSGGNKISIHLSGNEHFICIKVEDNGTGFDPEIRKGTGNGLINMKWRATQAGYNLSISKAAPEGSIVQITSGNYLKK
ncbi:MAG: hypothetical protein IT214_04030 [Chitinophagaceae bacterium]|nr:hypothetical protein [Chitinophagaceae bacterium]